MAERSALMEGTVVASHGRHCMVETPDGARRICHPRGKKNQAVVGDHVLWQAPPPGQGEEGTIEKVKERRNLFYRQDEIRTKSFAANLDQVLILIAAEPVFSESQLARALIAAEAEGIKPLIALNKSDLVEPFARAWERLLPYRHMGAGKHYGVLPLSLALSSDVDRALLMEHLQGKTTLVLGPSGSGKSTLINLLVPGASVLTGEISQALNSGKHTTTSTHWYWMDAARTTALIDSPGFQEFGLHHIAPMQLAACMPDIAEHATACKFYNCTHLHEPGCGVLDAVKIGPSAGGISPSRYKIYSDLFEELSHTRIDATPEALLNAALPGLNPLAQQARQREQRQQQHPHHHRAPHQADHTAQVAHFGLAARGGVAVTHVGVDLQALRRMQLGARLQRLTAQAHIDGPRCRSKHHTIVVVGKPLCVKTPAFNRFFKAAHHRETQRREPRRQPVDGGPGLC